MIDVAMAEGRAWGWMDIDLAIGDIWRLSCDGQGKKTISKLEGRTDERRTGPSPGRGENALRHLPPSPTAQRLSLRALLRPDARDLLRLFSTVLLFSPLSLPPRPLLPTPSTLSRSPPRSLRPVPLCRILSVDTSSEASFDLHCTLARSQTGLICLVP